MCYAGLAGSFLTFFSVFTAATQIEMHGPSDAATGRVLERERNERTATFDLNPERVSRRSVVTYPADTVIGERDDGTSWLVVGEEPYRFAGPVMGDDITVRALDGREPAVIGRDNLAEELAVRVTFGDLPPKGTWTIPIP